MADDIAPSSKSAARRAQSIVGADEDRCDEGTCDPNRGSKERDADRSTESGERERRLRALAIELSRAERRERIRLAHVLHDDAQQALVAAQMRLNLIETDGLDDTGREDFRQAIDLLHQCQRSLRTLACELAPPALQERGLAAALEWLADRMKDQHRLQVSVVADPEAEAIGLLVRDLLFQVVRELLLNVAKHAQTDRVQLRLTRTDAEIVLEVRDGGCGFDSAAAETAAAESFGLFHARERLRYVGGELQIDSTPGVGACVTLRVPAHSEEDLSDVEPETNA